MNREIKFRVWVDNQFYYKCLVGNTNNTNDDNWTCPMIWLEDKKEWVNCDNGIISQYTGLKDKNGKKIFEGDIMKNKQGGIGIVKYSKYAEFILDFIDDIFVSSFNPSILRRYEVIGNIYENDLETKGE